MVRKLFVGLLVAAFMVTSVGCFGSFSLTKKIYDVNEKIGSNVIQTVVMWAFIIVPVYEVSGFIDVVFLNFLEFWTGSNPIAISSGDVQEKIVRKDGELYRVEIGKGKVSVTGLSGSHRGKNAMLVFDRTASTCKLVSGSQERLLCSFNQRSATVDLHYPDGSVRTCDADTDVPVAFSR